MSERAIRVPDLGEGIAEVELVAWHVAVGDTVKEDQALADVMTDKATVEVPSSFAGRVVALGGEVGQVLAVGSDLIRIETDAEAGAEAARPARTEPSKPPAAPAPSPAPASPAKPAAAAPKRPPPTAGERPIASPAVRARAWELGIDLREVRASGSAGRIMQADLEAHAAKHPARKPAPRRAAAPIAAGPAPADETEKVIGLRRKIAERMQESKRRIPHYAYVEEIDVTELEATRATLNAQWADERGHLTVLPFIARAIVRSIRAFPQVNAHLDDDAGLLTRFGAVHLGIATQTDAGLMVPVLRDAQNLDLWGIAAELARLADAARSGKIVRNELTGSTITITSLGKTGGIVTTPVINRPEVAIVGVNRIAWRPMIVGGAIVPRQMMNLSSCFDHRVVDGAVAADFIQAVRGMLEKPATLFVD